MTWKAEETAKEAAAEQAAWEADRSDTPFRVYVVDRNEVLHCVGVADDVSLADLLVSLHGRGVIGNGNRAGIMYRPVDGAPGDWLVKPWTKGVIGC